MQTFEGGGDEVSEGRARNGARKVVRKWGGVRSIGADTGRARRGGGGGGVDRSPNFIPMTGNLSPSLQQLESALILNLVWRFLWYTN